jgi:hypothetical protein
MLNFLDKKYTLQQVYGIEETPLKDCPTYVERDVHKEFKYLVENESQHIIVYGASRQGKSWMVERYCTSFIRVGCDAKYDRSMLFKAILDELKVIVGETKTSNEYKCGNKIKASGEGNIEIPFVAKAKAAGTGEISDEGSKSKEVTYLNVDLNNQSEVIKAIKKVLGNRFIVIENFHYLNIETQKAFAGSLREFLYHKIRVIIVGVWKETTKLSSYASDLTNRCEYIDIGNWNSNELKEIVKKGDKALKIHTDEKVVDLFINNSGYNVGIFKSLLKNFYKECKIFETQSQQRNLSDIGKANRAIDKCYDEVISPVLERIDNLATSKKPGAKGMRYYIVEAILNLISKKDVEEILNGIDYQDILDEIHELKAPHFDSSNIKQELISLHLREETGKSGKGTNKNIIPLFYFDRAKSNGKLFIVESALICFKQSGKLKLHSYLGPIDNYVK